MEEDDRGRAVKSIQLLPLGRFDPALLSHVREILAAELSAECDLLQNEPEPSFALDLARRQYCSTKILASLLARSAPRNSRILALTSVDLYVPILTFVFGEAQLNGSCAVVSTFRLRQEFYGLPADDHVLRERLEKECVHELGHTFGIPHCADYECVMASSHAVEWIDLKRRSLCPSCRSQLNQDDHGAGRPASTGMEAP